MSVIAETNSANSYNMNAMAEELELAACYVSSFIVSNFTDKKTLENFIYDAFIRWGIDVEYENQPPFNFDVTIHDDGLNVLFYTEGPTTVRDPLFIKLRSLISDLCIQIEFRDVEITREQIHDFLEQNYNTNEYTFQSVRMDDPHELDEDLFGLTPESDVYEVPLNQMNEKLVQLHLDHLGREPRDECNEWHIDYSNNRNENNTINNDSIIRYSFCKFTNCLIEYHGFTNLYNLRDADFRGCTFSSCVFDNVEFVNCNFDGAVFNATTSLDNVKFSDCSMTGITFQGTVRNLSIDNF